MPVILSGAAGFIGSATLEVLLGKYSKVVGIDNLYSSALSNVRNLLETGKLIFIEVDVSDFESLWEKIRYMVNGENVEGIVHLAAIVNVAEVHVNPRLALKVNVIGTQNMLELARLLDVERFVFASSAAVYGEPQYLPVDESHPLTPTNLYGLSKLMGEQLVMRYGDDYGIKPIILRYFNVYGPRMRPGQYSGVIYRFIKSLVNRNKPVIYGDGKQTRDFVYVYDVAKANLKGLESKYVGVLNIGTGVETSINKLYELICNTIGVDLEPLREKPRPGDVKRSVADISKAREFLGWSPDTSLEEGIKKTILFYRRNR